MKTPGRRAMTDDTLTDLQRDHLRAASDHLEAELIAAIGERPNPFDRYVIDTVQALRDYTAEAAE